MIDEIKELIDKQFNTVADTSIYDNMIAVIEKAIIVKALERSNGNQIEAAKLIGLNRNTLHKKIAKYQIDVESFK